MIKVNLSGSEYVNVPAKTTLAADAHLAEGQFLLEEETLNNAKSLIYRAGTRRPTISKSSSSNSNKG
jgi:hypothetical protein